MATRKGKVRRLRYGRQRNGGNGPTDDGRIKQALERLITGVVKNVMKDHGEYNVTHGFTSSFSKRLASSLLQEHYVNLYADIVFDETPIPKPCDADTVCCEVGTACVSIKKIQDA